MICLSQVFIAVGVNRMCLYFAVFQNVFKAPQFCSRCGVAYKVVHELRGYMCVSFIPHTLYTPYLILIVVFFFTINLQLAAILLQVRLTYYVHPAAVDKSKIIKRTGAWGSTGIR